MVADTAGKRPDRRFHRLLIPGLVSLALITAAVYWFVGREDGSIEEGRYERGETALAISGGSAGGMALYKSGASIVDSVQSVAVDVTELWLRPGNYVLSAGTPERRLLYPIPLTGYRCGPDDGGSYLVTVRPYPPDNPPPIPSGMSRMRYIPSGSFLLGDRQNPRERHYVWLTGYFVAEFEVTNAEFRVFVSAPDGYADDRNWTAEGLRWRTSSESRASALLGPKDSQYRRFGQADQPLTLVTWFEAVAYCHWLTRTVGGEKWLFTLPTDAEWEKAARGPDNFDFALGMALSDRETPLYNWRKNPWSDTTVVGVGYSREKILPNRYGLYHMTGNVVEWSLSVHRPNNRDHPYTDDDRNVESTAGPRSARGGSWYSASNAYLYIPYRDSFQPEHRTQDLGFRIVARILP